MPAGLIIPISGPMVSTWSSLALGVLNDDGLELQCTLPGQEVRASDVYGETLVEGIYRGQNWIVRLRGLEWFRAGLLSILQMFGQTGAGTTLTPILANIGDRWTKFCQALLLTAILGNPPTYPQSITAASSGFSPNSASAFNITSKVREMPLELVLFPYSAVVNSVSVIVPFTTT